LAVIEKAILFYREKGKTGERFSQTIERLGFDNVEAQVLSDEISTRKQEILDAKLHVTVGATC
jgi:NAD(P)H-nitrite reductase large subunit